MSGGTLAAAATLWNGKQRPKLRHFQTRNPNLLKAELPGLAVLTPATTRTTLPVLSRWVDGSGDSIDQGPTCIPD